MPDNIVEGLVALFLFYVFVQFIGKFIFNDLPSLLASVVSGVVKTIVFFSPVIIYAVIVTYIVYVIANKKD